MAAGPPSGAQNPDQKPHPRQCHRREPDPSGHRLETNQIDALTAKEEEENQIQKKTRSTGHAPGERTTSNAYA